MASNASRGAAAKGKTKKWLEARGYQVAHLEQSRWIWKDGRPAFAVKQDQFASDLLAVSEKRIVFVQVKSGESASGGTFPAARREFAKFVFPPFAQLLIVAWAPRAREPRLIKVLTDGTFQEIGKRPLLDKVETADGPKQSD